MKKILAICIIALASTGCATRGAGYVPLVDTKGKSLDAVNQDTIECQQYAKQRDDAVGGAIAGAVFGAVIGAIVGHGTQYQGAVAGQTAALGALGGAGRATETQESVIKNCLAGRGYNVLN